MTPILTCWQSINQLLRSAGLALKILSSSQSPSETPSQTVSARKQEFEQATNNYLTTLQTVDVGLKRQIWGLEEAGIIVEKKVRETQEPRTGEKIEKEIEGGTGKLDIGWLNSRSGKVGRDNEAELWKKAREFLEGIDAEERSGADDVMEG